MSTREMVYSTIEKMTDEQVTAVFDFIKTMTENTPDDRISDDEILCRLEEAEEDFRCGRYMSYEQYKERMERHINELRLNA